AGEGRTRTQPAAPPRKPSVASLARGVSLVLVADERDAIQHLQPGGGAQQVVDLIEPRRHPATQLLADLVGVLPPQLDLLLGNRGRLVHLSHWFSFFYST